MCPEPLLEAETFFQALPAGCRVRVLATDPAASIDFEVWCLQKGHLYRGCDTHPSHLEIHITCKAG
jgi:TusA-related sulfurtransferase